ncbi:hypothetical protein CFU_3160 [Collimonas fungivorans Ter331]|uniref:Uncharacterized protein n=1 Tax=Collimonas fungivorans (strain Ter331) TaxID=1005048 RepID=G0AA51_COLFT|nr:hypothetical protein CFU_3160 [Collimonas fungivorans Ter331]
MFDSGHVITATHFLNVSKYCGEIFQAYEGLMTVL